MANMFTDTGRVEKAVPLLREALRENPNQAEIHWELGYAYRFGGMSADVVGVAKDAEGGLCSVLSWRHAAADHGDEASECSVLHPAPNHKCRVAL